MTGNSLLMQLQADLLGRPIVVPEDAEMTAAGAAYAAGLATGFWSEEALPARRRTARRFEPSSNEESRRRRMERWRQGVARSLDWADPIDYPSA
jgi:glycerol kinase